MGYFYPLHLPKDRAERRLISYFPEDPSNVLCVYLPWIFFYEKGKTNKMKQFKVNANKMANHFRITGGGEVVKEETACKC